MNIWRANEHWLTASSLRITTAAPESQTCEGTLYTADPIANLVVLRLGTSDKSGDYRIIPVSRIQSFQIMSLATRAEMDIANAQPKIAELDLKRLEKRCDDRVAALKEQAKSKGKGVTMEAQAIFDALKRMYAHHTYVSLTRHC